MKAALFWGRFFVLCCYFLPAWVAWIFLSSDDLAGGGPAAAHFSCFAKKSKQKKATASS